MKGQMKEAEAIHGLITKKIRDILEGDEVTPQELKVAIDWMKVNGITAFIEEPLKPASTKRALSAMPMPDMPPLEPGLEETG